MVEVLVISIDRRPKGRPRKVGNYPIEKTGYIPNYNKVKGYGK